MDSNETLNKTELTGNKGEWSELYVLFKLLGDEKVYAGNGDLERIEDLFYPILKILRNEKGKEYVYAPNDDIVIITEDDKEVLRKNVKDFLDKAKELRDIIHKSKGAFSAPSIEVFMNEIFAYTLKAPSKDKTDIHIVIHDPRTGMDPKLGFSIKSQLGNNSTLLNASQSTNFSYLIKGANFTDEEIQSINSIETHRKIQDRVKKILNYGGKFCFYQVDDRVFRNNLIMIDSYLPEIIGEILISCYIYRKYDLKELTKIVTKQNPMGYDMSDNDCYYEHKVKNLLVATALGMMPHTPWSGKYDANGGYLVVKEDGDVLCYHFYDRNLFEDYLFCNTKLETPSIGRYAFAQIEKKGNDLLFRLNLQIRFK